NKDLVLNSEKLKSIDFKEIKEYFSRNGEFIDGVVISGGEPTIYPDIEKLCEEIKKLGFKIKIDTNGSNPEMLKLLLDKKLIDYVAMDIKTDFEKYKEVTNSEIDAEKIKKSISVLSQFPEYEFRTTIFPKIEKQDLIKIAEYLKEKNMNKAFFLHQFKPDTCLDEEFEKEKPYPDEKILEFYEAVKSFFDKCEIRNL
ncbi:MAG TPA: anaerobic ribonucleoside-triphosphate reductase activating protein, partial [Candidatus Omnitrophota bacterium]|nr:anaerobic ribonucleoside-triphosphate reductase activating protein [Candidatus Omnitrophota bacterium]